MKYELRELRAEDVFPMLRIISKIGIKEFKACFGSDAIQKLVASGEKDKDRLTTAVGMAVALDVAGVLVTNLPAAENDIYQFLANISDVPKDEIKGLGMTTFFEMIVAVIRKEEFKDFFKAVSRLFKPET